MLRRLLSTEAPRATALVRAIVGWIFLSEGIQKFLHPAALGAGRFAKIGIPAPQVMGPFVGAVEIAAGALLIAGLATRPAAAALLVDISVAILSTKLPMLVHRGFWAAMHEARTDLSMWFGLLFLLAVGAGPLSVDARLARH